ncbi:MAG: citramalate synthase [Planctomycetota bacterium]
MKLCVFDTTLRDGAQTEGISFSVEDKLDIVQQLDDFGIHMIEAGWPGSNPKDAEFFAKAKTLTLKRSRLVAFGMTRRAGLKAEEDPSLRALVEAETPIVAVVGKSSKFQVEKVLRVSHKENLAMISDTVAWLKELGREVVYDAEHFFDAWREDSEHALATLRAAAEAGADFLALCDTNGGSMPWEVAEAVGVISSTLDVPLGIHAHDDCGLAVANSLAAVRAGCAMVQGTVNGYGERCGNANLISLLPTFQLKMNSIDPGDFALGGLRALARRVSEISNVALDPSAAYVGRSAFAHKGGIHVAAVERARASYEHIDPQLVGNDRRISVSELSGQGNVRMQARNLNLDIQGHEAAILAEVKRLEAQGFHFEGAEASFYLLTRRHVDDYQAPFAVEDFSVRSECRNGGRRWSEASLRISLFGEDQHVVASGVGPIHALDRAFRKALMSAFPAISDCRLVDYKVRILDHERATAATTRVSIEAARGDRRWTTVGCGPDIVEASALALADSYEYLLENSDLLSLECADDSSKPSPLPKEIREQT